MQRHDLVNLTGVFDSMAVGGFDDQAGTLAVQAIGPNHRLCPNINPPLAIYPFYLKPRYAYNPISVGYRCSPLI